jgi:hypothetical protein
MLVDVEECWIETQDSGPSVGMVFFDSEDLSRSRFRVAERKFKHIWRNVWKFVPKRKRENNGAGYQYK